MSINVWIYENRRKVQVAVTWFQVTYLIHNDNIKISVWSRMNEISKLLTWKIDYFHLRFLCKSELRIYAEKKQ